MDMMNLLLLALLQGERLEWTIGEDAREALVFAPARKDGAPPLVFAFHGHGGTMRNASRSFRIHEEWPEAVVVYPQGLPTPGKISDPEGKKPGWQHAVGDHGDRDLKFFDAVLAAMKEKYRIDEKRVYSTGHSNGGGFTYLLWSARPGVFAAIAPSAAGAGGLRTAKDLRPVPVLHVAGEKDPVVPFETQKKTIDAIRKLNECEAEGKEWAKGCMIYASPKKAPVVTFVHDGDHKYPREAPALIAKFFREHARE
jgi:polyhydroxybutyrate depolymerase